MNPDDLENMSDEDFAKLENPGGSAPVEEPENTPEPEMAQEDTGLFDESDGETTLEDELNATSKEAVEEETDQASPAEEVEEDEELAADSNHTTPEQTEPKADPEDAALAADDGSDAGEEESVKQASVEEAYAKIMAPFKANGRDFTPKDPDEVVRLMQMGANYAKKMQTLRPNLRMVKMLENKNLLDEEKLNFLIDLNDRNPQAIQKLLHDSKIDPLDLDTSETPKYTPTNHSVSDAQYQFQETLTDLTSTSGGSETVQIINQSWDKASKEAVFEDPKILPLIHEQRENGIYDRITDELERQKLLGKFGDMPFIHAYKAVGDYLHKRGELIPTTQTDQSGNVAQETPRQMVETRTAKPRTNLANSDRAAKTAMTRSTPSPAKKSFDPMSMSDEEIMAMSLPNS